MIHGAGMKMNFSSSHRHLFASHLRLRTDMKNFRHLRDQKKGVFGFIGEVSRKDWRRYMKILFNEFQYQKKVDSCEMACDEKKGH